MSFRRFLVLTMAAILLIARVGLGCDPAIAMSAAPEAAMDERAACHGDASEDPKPAMAMRTCLMACALAPHDQPMAVVGSAFEIMAPAVSPALPLAGFVARPSIPPPRLAERIV